MSNPRVVIGAGRPNKLAALVAEFTIKKHCPEAEVIHTYDTPFIKGRTNGEDNLWHRDRWGDQFEWIPTGHPTGTMFSFCRHMLPEICGVEGKALYIDSDMVVLSSIQEIFEMDMEEAWVLGVIGCHQNSVQLVDCEKTSHLTLKKLLETWSYKQLQRNNHLGTHFTKKIPKVWNIIDRHIPAAKLVHYTHMPTQPWINPVWHRAGGLWFECLTEAVVEGVIPVRVVEEECRENPKGTWQAAAYPAPHVMERLKVLL